MKRCSRCILPESFPDLTFDANGVCHRCHEHDQKYATRDFVKLKIELEKIANWARSQKKQYDCVVPLSGGKDSAYTLYVCSVQLGLKVLAVNFNNGLCTPEAVDNMARMTRITGAAYTSYGPPWETMRKLYRAFLLATGQFCFPCDMGIWATVHRVAEDYDVPLIVSGFSEEIETRGAKIYSYTNTLFRKVAGRILPEKGMHDFLAESLGQRIFRRLKHGRLTRYRRQISLPDYMPWKDAEIKNVISEKLGWISRADGSSDHIDCYFAPVKAYLNIQKWGFGEKTTKYAAMTRAGQLTRNEALALAEAEESKDVGAAIERFRDWLGVSSQDLSDAKNKTHLDLLH